MFRTTHARRSLAMGAAGALISLGALAAAPGAGAAPVTPTPSAGPAQTCCHTTLSVAGPTAVGLAGQPVGFTEKVTNTSATESEDLFLELVAHADGIPPNGLGLWYRTDSGAWKRLPLDYHRGSFTGRLPFTLVLGPRQTRVLHLRFGLPMGAPHDGDGNGGARSVRLTSSVGARDGSWALQARDVRTVKVQGMTARLRGVPARAVPGGAPAEFTATTANTTASDYVDVSGVLFTDRYTVVRVFRAGRWVTLRPVVVKDDPGTVGYYLPERDHAVPAGSTGTVRLRISWKASAPLGRTNLTQSVIVNEGSPPFRGTYVGAASAHVTLAKDRSSASHPASPATTSAPRPPRTAAAAPTPSPTASATPDTGTRLAETGVDASRTLDLSLGGAGLVLAGGSLLAYTRLRRRP